MNWQGKWIWLAEEPSSCINLRILARKQFRIDSVRRATLLITADSRYRLFINGTWVDDGPARSFPWAYSYDRIDVARFLRPGNNVLAVVVQHFGEGTFQALVTRPGLLAQLDVDGRTIGSDSSWRMCVDPSYNRMSPRVSCQLPYEEQVDGRREPMGWRGLGFDDSNWQRAKVVASVPEGPWRNLTERDIPLLTVEKMRPVRVVSQRRVRRPSFVETINIDRAFRLGNIKTGIRSFNGAILTSIVSLVAQKVRFFKPHGLRPMRYFINGKIVNTPERIGLRKGDNPVVLIFEGPQSDNEFQIILDAPRRLRLRNPFGRGRWAVAGPFEPADAGWENKFYVGIPTAKGKPSYDPENSDWEQLKKARTLEQLRRCGLTRLFRDVPGMACVDTDVQALTSHPIASCKGDLEVVYDFGKELNAKFEIEIDAPEAMIIDATSFEAYRDGEPQYTGNCRTAFRYITRQGPQAFVTFRNFGARYLALTFRNAEGHFELPQVTAHFVHCPVEHRGEFQCSDYLLNRIWQAGKHTLLCCMEDTFTDCPTYEQALWVGDARNEALVCHTTFGQYDLTRRCARLCALSLTQADLTVCQVPSGWDHVMPTWSLLWVQMVWEHFCHSGDAALLEELYPAVAKMLATIREKYLDSATGLFSIAAGNMFDWTGMDICTKLTTHNNIFLVAALKAASCMARVLMNGDPWQGWARELTRRINRHLWSQQRQAYIDSIHNDGAPSACVSRPTNTVAILYDIAPADRAERILPIVLGRRAKNIVPFGSPFASFFLLEALAKLGRFDELLKTVRGKWGYMLDAGATTFWETFEHTRSHCHAWSAGPTYFLSRYVLGVHPMEPGYRTVLFSPQPGDLEFARGSVPTPSGNIHVQWQRNERLFEMIIDKPAAIRGKIELPQGMKMCSLKKSKTRIHFQARIEHG